MIFRRSVRRGNIDFVKTLQVHQEVEYSYLVMPDHVPIAPNDTEGLQSFACCYGYIRALLQAMERLGRHAVACRA
jgi:mannonate dehydratase